MNVELLVMFAILLPCVCGFAPHAPNSRLSKLPIMNMSGDSAMADVESMKASELRKELQSYGISTKSFFEKNELVDAVMKARSEGKIPKAPAHKESDSSTSSKSASKKSRNERISEEMEICKSMKVGELKRELASYGVSTKTFFEKSEFVRAVAEARVDGKKKASAAKEEEYDPSYRDVVMQKMTGDPRSAFGSGQFIDIKLGR